MKNEGAPEPLHTGAGEVLGEKVSFESPILHGSRVDQEALADFNTIRELQRKMDRSDRTIGRLHATAQWVWAYVAAAALIGVLAGGAIAKYFPGRCL